MSSTPIRWLARCWPVAVTVDDDLVRAVGFLGWETGARTVASAGAAGAVLLALAGLAVQVIVGGPIGLAAAALGLGLGALAARVDRLVVCLAKIRRANALGAAPALVTRLTLRMQLTPAPEAAARFGADASRGPLADSLAGHVRRTANGPESGLGSFGREWTPFAPSLERACGLIESASREPPGERADTLARARETVLEGVQDRTAAFAASIRGPVSALYAFGVLLPLALAALLPALDAAGVPASLSLLVLVYDVCLPVGLVGASAWLLAKRPIAFRPARVPRSHPAVWSTLAHAGAASLAAALAANWLVGRLVAPWAGSLAAVGAAVGVALIVAFQPMQSVRDEVAEIEGGLPDALSLIGRRVDGGTATEAAITAVATEVPGPTGDLLATAADRQRRLGVDLRTAFDGPNGTLVSVPSERAESAAALLAVSAREGRPAGEGLTAMGDHLRALDEGEREARRAVAQVTNTLSNTAAVFGPLVGGATVALAAAMGSTGPIGGTVATADLGLAVGAYVLVLAAVLTALATGLTDGLDRSLIGYRVGLAVLAATATYLVAFVGAGLLI
jgi:Flp pilus assembly protein TadB